MVPSGRVRSTCRAALLVALPPHQPKARPLNIHPFASPFCPTGRGQQAIILACKSLSQPVEGQSGSGEELIKSCLGSHVPAHLWTLPRIWKQVKADTGYDERLVAVQRFNTSSKWVKRGLSITPIR